MMKMANQLPIDPYLCTCGPCKRFWNDTFRSSSEYLLRHAEERAHNSATLGTMVPQLISVGDRVSTGGNTGKVKFVGYIDDTVVAPVLRVGIRLDEPVLLGHDGTYNGKRYFHCTPGHGIMVRVKDVTLLKPADKRPPVRGNPMFPSYPEVCRRRKQRDAILERMHEVDKNRRASLHNSDDKKATARPPAISPRENLAQKLRREASSMPLTHTSYMISKDDPHDLAYKDHQKMKRKQMLVARLPSTNNAQVQWEQRLMLQWHQKYGDPEKASRMGETLLKLCSAYREGQKLGRDAADQ